MQSAPSTQAEQLGRRKLVKAEVPIAMGRGGPLRNGQGEEPAVRKDRRWPSPGGRIHALTTQNYASNHGELPRELDEGSK